MIDYFWPIFGVATAIKVLLIPSYHSTDFEVHRNWLAITHNLPLKQWYVDETSEWTLDYPPFFAYMEWALSHVAVYFDKEMIRLDNLNYASQQAKVFQRVSVMFTDIIFAIGVLKCLRALKIQPRAVHYFTGGVLLLLNVGLLFVDHIHFQYNGFLFGILLLSISFLLNENYLLSAFTFAVLLNFKHIFLYMAPAFGVYLLRFYCWEVKAKYFERVIKLVIVGVTPFIFAFGPFYQQLPQVLSRLFPFKRGLTHAYWAPNFWAIYNTCDKIAALIFGVKQAEGPTTSSGLVQEFKHVVLCNVSPAVTFVLTVAFMIPILIKLLIFTEKRNSKKTFLRAVVLCSCASFMFGWHVHEKAILMCLIPLSLLTLIDEVDAKYNFILGIVGYFSLFPLLFHVDLLILRYSLYLAYMSYMHTHIERMYGKTPNLNFIEKLYIYGYIGIPSYEHILHPILGFDRRLPFLPLLLTSLYCSLGVLYFFIRYYILTFKVEVVKASSESSSLTGKVVNSKGKVKRKLK